MVKGLLGQYYVEESSIFFRSPTFFKAAAINSEQKNVRPFRD